MAENEVISAMSKLGTELMAQKKNLSAMRFQK